MGTFRLGKLVASVHATSKEMISPFRKKRKRTPQTIRSVVMALMGLMTCSNSWAQSSSLPVFPGAMGFGTTTVAGSGRGTVPAKTTVMKVTNLNDSGTGSLRACMQATGPRTCVFEVAGYINLLTRITVKSPNLSVFGQTAPYPGIQVRDGSIVVQADDVLIQHIASRPGDRNLPTDGGNGIRAGDRDGMGVWGRTSSDPVERVVFDHVSITWGMDESFSTYTGVNSTPDGTTPIRDVTISNSLIAEGLNNSNHGDTEGKHSMFSLLGSNSKNFTYYRNIVANSNGRHVRMKSNSDVEFLNNYVYNFANTNTAGYNQWNMDYSSSGAANRINFMNNYYKRGPTTADTSSPVFFYSKLTPLASRIFVSHNIGTNTRPTDSGSEWLIANANGKGLPSSMQALSPAFPLSNAALNLVAPSELLSTLASAVGARPWNRYPHDNRIMNEVITDRGQHKDCTTTATCCVTGTGGSGYCPTPGRILIDGSIKDANNPKDAWSAIPTAVRGFNVPANALEIAPNGYTNLENFIFSFTSDVGATAPVATATAVPPTATPSMTPTATSTPTVTPTRSPMPSPTPTNTPLPPSPTSTATPTATPTSTPTDVPPTFTSTPMPTHSPTATTTATPVISTIPTPSKKRFRVRKVTSLADSGVGSLRECVEGEEPRVCVFETSGRIGLASDLVVARPDLIVVGQTAPSPGIMITNGGFTISTQNVRIEHLTIRSGDDSDGTNPRSRRAITVEGASASDVILKNLSLSWGVDGNVSLFGPVNNVTLQDSIIAEPLWRSIHPSGRRGNGILVGEGARNALFVRNLLASNVDRNIRWKYDTQGEMINNVIYGWGGTTSWNTTNISDLEDKNIATYLDIIGNIFRSGPSGLSTAYGIYSKNTPTGTRVFIYDNRAPKISNVESKYRAAARIFDGPAALPSSTTFESVLASAGARPWDRNPDDKRIIAGVRARTLKIRDRVGTWPTYNVTTREVGVNSDLFTEEELSAAMSVFEDPQTSALIRPCTCAD